MTAAVDSIIGHLKKKVLGKNHLMFLSHAGAPEDAAAVKRRMAEIFPELEILILELGPAFVTQGRPAMPCNPIHKQIKRSSSRSFWAAVFFVREREYGWEFMENNHKSAGEKTVCRMCQKPFFLEWRGFPARGYIWGTWKKSEINTIYCIVK